MPKLKKSEGAYDSWRSGYTLKRGDNFSAIRLVYFKKVFAYLWKKLTTAILGDYLYMKLAYRYNHGYWWNLKNPEHYQERLQWIRQYGNLERFSMYCDKYEVRDYVKRKVGEKYLVPLIGIYNNTKEIDFEKLPDRFIMKATHGSGWNYVVKDKSSVNWKSVTKKFDKWLRKNYFNLHGEKNYKPLKGRIIIEKLIEDPSGDLKDYKLLCSNGKPRYITVDSDRFGDRRLDVYDTKWHKIPMVFQVPNHDEPVPKPENLDEMLEVTAKLASDFRYVRVDLYNTGNRIFFGELTFTPGNGLAAIIPEEWAYKFAELIDIEHFNDPYP